MEDAKEKIMNNWNAIKVPENKEDNS